MKKEINGRFTAQSTYFCQLMAEGKLSQVDAYIEAYPKSKAWGKAAASVAASNLAAKPHIKQRIEQMREAIDKQRAIKYQWSKEKASEKLIQALEKIEDNLELIEKAKKKMLEDQKAPSSIVSTITYSTNASVRALKEVAAELNSIYGLNKQNIQLNGALSQQVIFEGEDQLPPDENQVDNEGNEV